MHLHCNVCACGSLQHYPSTQVKMNYLPACPRRIWQLSERPGLTPTQVMPETRYALRDDSRGAIMTLDTTANVPDIYAAINKELASVCDQLRERVGSSNCGDDVVSLVMAVPADTLLQ